MYCTVAERMPEGSGGGEAAGRRPEPVKQQVPTGCRRYSGHPCHGPEKKSKGAQRSGSDMHCMFHRCIASGADTRRSAGQGAAGSQWPVSEQRLGGQCEERRGSQECRMDERTTASHRREPGCSRMFQPCAWSEGTQINLDATQRAPFFVPAQAAR